MLKQINHNSYPGIPYSYLIFPVSALCIQTCVCLGYSTPQRFDLVEYKVTKSQVH